MSFISTLLDLSICATPFWDSVYLLKKEAGWGSGTLDLTSETFGLSESGSFPRWGRSIGAPFVSADSGCLEDPPLGGAGRGGGNLHNKIQGQLSKETSQQVRPAVVGLILVFIL